MAEIDIDLTGLVLNQGEVALTEALRYLLAGKSIVTFSNKKNNTHKTYMCIKSKRQNAYWLYAMTGTDNIKHYTWFGRIDIENYMPKYSFVPIDKQNENKTISKDSPSVVAFEHIWNIIQPTYLTVINNDYNKLISTDCINYALRFDNEAQAKGFIDLKNLNNSSVVNINVAKNKTFSIIQRNIEHESLVMYYSSHCCRCGILLTNPESIKRHMGPHCAKMFNMGNNFIYSYKN